MSAMLIPLEERLVNMIGDYLQARLTTEMFLCEDPDDMAFLERHILSWDNANLDNIASVLETMLNLVIKAEVQDA